MTQRVLILGAYGLIGSGVTRHLIGQGGDVIGMGRNATTAQRVLPDLRWVIGDIQTFLHPDDWAPMLDGITGVVNCSGALQDGRGDDLETLHHHAVAALAGACADKNIQLIQISATGAHLQASTGFLSSKARGDAAIRAAGGHHVILRPGLILAPEAYGGSALLRMLAAVPWVQPMALGDSPIQTVALDDVAQVVAQALAGDIPNGTSCDLVEPTPHRLADVQAAVRHWMGFPPALIQIAVPNWMAKIIGKAADGLAHLGWATPLRSTALQVLREGVRGDATQLDRLKLAPLSNLNETLAASRATSSDRLAARMGLLTPVIIATLALFWGLSGLVGLVRLGPAAEVLTDVGWTAPLARFSVVFWAFVDMSLAAGILVRRTAALACWGMVATSLLYLGASTLFVPHLWLDPLGPLVKILPAILLPLIARTLLDRR